MTERDAKIESFLSRSGWSDALRAVLAGDASNRRYLRLVHPETGERAVLMDAPPDKGEDVLPFIRICGFLRGLNLSAPDIKARDEDAGFLLLEDLGDDLFARVIPREPQLENSLYSAAIDVLIQLHAHAPPPGLEAYGPAMAAPLSALAYDWYLPAATDQENASAKSEFMVAMQDALAAHAPDCDVLIQRDYHAENLLWLPERDGVGRVGLLDFQDAALGHRAYDLVSLLQDARRDVPTDIEVDMIARYIDATGQPSAAFKAAYATLGVQRSLRILGVFARLCVRDGKPGYLDFLPRVWGLLQRDLAHPNLSALQDIIDKTLPSPSPEILDKVKAKCATDPRR